MQKKTKQLEKDWKKKKLKEYWKKSEFFQKNCKKPH